MNPVGIIRFLGTNCDFDVWQAVEAVGLKPQWIHFKENFSSKDFGALILPGGFSYGDYLRSGAFASRMPVMKSLKEASKKGVPILGICNGFQILCEAKLLPGTLVRNEKLKFIDKFVNLKLENPSPFWGGDKIQKVRLPIAHGEGRYFASKEELKKIKEEGSIWLTYEKNPNGSCKDIAGIKKGNVAGLMPHPERALFSWMGGEDGKAFFETLVQ